MRLLPHLAIVLALALAPGCLATASAYQALTEEAEVTGTVVWVAVLPALLAIDIVTAPFQYLYVISHAPD